MEIKSIFSAVMLTVLMVSNLSCSTGIYSDSRFEAYQYGAYRAAGELSKGNFVYISNQSIDCGDRFSHVVRGAKYKPLRSDITFEQYLTEKYGIKYYVLSNASPDYISGYHMVMTAALRERFGDDYFERARREFYPNVREEDFNGAR